MSAMEQKPLGGCARTLRESAPHADIWDAADALDRPIVILSASSAEDERKTKLSEGARAYSAIQSRSLPSLLATGEDDGIAWFTFERAPSGEPITATSHMAARTILRQLAVALDGLREANIAAPAISVARATLVHGVPVLAEPCLGIAQRPAVAHAEQRALGRLAYELLSGRLPDELPARFEIQGADSSRLHAAFLRALAAGPSSFFASCIEFVHEIDLALEPPSRQDKSAERFSPAVPARPSIVLRRKTQRLQNVLMGLGIVVIAGLVVFGRRSREEATTPPGADTSTTVPSKAAAMPPQRPPPRAALRGQDAASKAPASAIGTAISSANGAVGVRDSSDAGPVSSAPEPTP